MITDTLQAWIIHKYWSGDTSARVVIEKGNTVTTSGTGFTMTAVYTGSTNASISCDVRPHSGALVDIFF